MAEEEVAAPGPQPIPDDVDPLTMDPVVLSRYRYRKLLLDEFNAGFEHARGVFRGPSAKLLARIDRYEGVVDGDDTLAEDQRVAILAALDLMRSRHSNVREKGLQQFGRLRKLMGAHSSAKEREKLTPVEDDDLELPA